MKGLTLATAALGQKFAMCDQYANIVEAFIENALNGREVFTGLSQMDHLAEAEFGIQGFERGGSTGTFRVLINEEVGLAVVPIVGMIVPKASSIGMSMQGTSMELLTNRIHELRMRDDIKGVILRVHSGGGSVLGVPEAAAAIRQLASEKPVHASIDMFAASAAYWLASAANKIYISESGVAGSIGVFAMIANQHRKLKKDGIDIEVIRRGAFKHRPNGVEAFDSDEMKAAIAEVDKGVERVYRSFISAISNNLGITMTQAEKLADGRVHEGEAAISAGLATDQGTFRDVATNMVLDITSATEDEVVEANDDSVEVVKADSEEVIETVLADEDLSLPVEEATEVVEATVEEVEETVEVSEVELLKAKIELLEAANAKSAENEEKTKISTLIATAVADGRIPVQKEAKFTALAEKFGFDAFSAMLAEIPVPTQIQEDLSVAPVAKSTVLVAEEVADEYAPTTEAALAMFRNSATLSKRYKL